MNRTPTVAMTLALALLILLSAATASAWAHAERPTTLVDYPGTVPQHRDTGPELVVCARDSRRRIRTQINDGLLIRWNLRWLRRCHYHEIQRAIDVAESGYRILVLPGIYTEPTSQHVPVADPQCSDYYTITSDGDRRLPAPQKYVVPTYDYHLFCPNSRNLIAIVGDVDRDPHHQCDIRCNLQLEGTGDDPGDVLLQGDRHKPDVLHVDRADGAYLANFTVQNGVVNGLNVIETNGFVVKDVVSRWNQNYGVLTFTDDNGLYEGVTSYGNGHAGVYPGSAAERHHQVEGGLEPPAGTGTTDCTGEHSIEMRGVESYGNPYGYSGTGGNGLWVHDSRFHDNATGMQTDSSAMSHPGLPQDCATWEHNLIYSNNFNPFAGNDEECTKPYDQREDLRIVCPYYQAPIGTGLSVLGGNDNIISSNYIYDNWRNGVRLSWIPAAARGVADPTKQYDTSNQNRIVGNFLSVDRDGRRAPNGNDGDLWWDEEGVGNCWSDNRGFGGSEPTSNPPGLQSSFPCPAGNPFSTGDADKIESNTCNYDPMTNRHPGCAWLTPPEPPK